MQLAEDVMDKLTEHVCDLAALRPTSEWPEEVRALVGAARRVKALYGMEVVKLDLTK